MMKLILKNVYQISKKLNGYLFNYIDKLIKSVVVTFTKYNADWWILGV